MKDGTCVGWTVRVVGLNPLNKSYPRDIVKGLTCCLKSDCPMIIIMIIQDSMQILREAVRGNRTAERRIFVIRRNMQDMEEGFIFTRGDSRRRQIQESTSTARYR